MCCHCHRDGFIWVLLIWHAVLDMESPLLGQKSCEMNNVKRTVPLTCKIASTIIKKNDIIVLNLLSENDAFTIIQIGDHYLKMGKFFMTVLQRMLFNICTFKRFFCRPYPCKKVWVSLYTNLLMCKKHQRKSC